MPSVFNMRVDSLAKKMEDAKWAMELVEVSEEAILETFDITEEELGNADGEDGEHGNMHAGMHEDKEEKDSSIKTHIVKHYWERSSKKYPDGREIILTGKLILHKGSNEKNFGELPFWHYYYHRGKNSLWGTGPFYHVQGIQREFNRMVSIQSEHHEGWRAKMLMPMGSILKEGAFTTDSFELLEFDNTRGEPKALQMPELSTQITAYRDYLEGAIGTVSNVHEVSYSQLPKYASRAPASLFSMMLEQEDLKIASMMKRINANFIKEGTFTLKLAESNYKQPRLIKIVGRGEEAAVEYFKGSEINGNYDVELAIGASLYQSKVIQQRLLVELHKEGIIEDKNKILKMLQLGDVGEELRGDFADEQRAIRENQAFQDKKVKIPDNLSTPEDLMRWASTRNPTGVYVWMHDNHEVHMDYHTNQMKTPEAEQWDDETYLAMELHIMAHWKFMQATLQMQQTAGTGGQQQGGAQRPTAPREQTGGARPGPIPKQQSGQAPGGAPVS